MDSTEIKPNESPGQIQHDLTQLWLEYLETKDEKIFHAIHLHTHLHVYLFIYGYFRHKEIAEDITQEVYEDLLKKKKTSKPVKNFKKWLFGIAYNKTQQKLKELIQEKKRYYDVEGSVIEANGPKERLNHMLDTDIILDAINKLKKNHCEVIKAELEGLSNTEIAQKLELSERQVRNRKYQGKRKLRDDLKRRGFEDELSKRNEKGRID